MEMCSSSDEDYEEDYEELLFLAMYQRRRRHRKRQKWFWVRSIFTQRNQRGSFSTLIQEMCLSDPEMHFKYLRMSKEHYDDLLHKVR